MTLDLSNADCGCNAAVYLVGMPESRKAGDCGDRYCDANAVCGVGCAEIDLVEANKVAFVSTVHVGDDPSGEAFGLGHYVNKQRRFRSAQACAYEVQHRPPKGRNGGATNAAAVADAADAAEARGWLRAHDHALREPRVTAEQLGGTVRATDELRVRAFCGIFGWGPWVLLPADPGAV